MALEYHRRGWSIVPIRAGTKKPPKGFRWRQYQKRRPTEDDLRFWFADRDDLGLAVILGEISGGLVCRDFDDLQSYRRWSRAHGDLARMMPAVATARGRHVYFRAPVSWCVFYDLRPQEEGEYRGDCKHYCLLPPSPHPGGSEYKWGVPLSEDAVPFIEDVVAAGLLPGESSSPHETQKAQGSHRWWLGGRRRLIARYTCPRVGERQSRKLSAAPYRQDREHAEPKYSNSHAASSSCRSSSTCRPRRSTA